MREDDGSTKSLQALLIDDQRAEESSRATCHFTFLSDFG